MIAKLDFHLRGTIRAFLFRAPENHTAQHEVQHQTFTISQVENQMLRSALNKYDAITCKFIDKQIRLRIYRFITVNYHTCNQ
ncbi:hypothetical protein D3C74_420600 [compost metagenome]